MNHEVKKLLCFRLKVVAFLLHGVPPVYECLFMKISVQKPGTMHMTSIVPPSDPG
jgi:hypothetical protein